MGGECVMLPPPALAEGAWMDDAGDVMAAAAAACCCCWYSGIWIYCSDPPLLAELPPGV